MSGGSYAKLYKAGYELADQIERNRHKVRPETCRGAFADLCNAIDNSKEKTISYNPRYWGMRWEWNDNEVKRFLDKLIETSVLFKLKKPGEKGHRITASKAICKQFVSNFVSKKPLQDEGSVAGCKQDCKRFVSKYPTISYLLSILPEWVNKGLFQEFIEMRLQNKKPMSERAVKMAVKKLKDLVDAGYPQDALIETAIYKCWDGFWPIQREKQEVKTTTDNRGKEKEFVVKPSPLPPDKFCSDCRQVNACRHNHGRTGLESECKWTPSFFQEKAA